LKKFTLPQKVFDLLKESNFFSDINGVPEFDSTKVAESKVGSKFFYSIKAEFHSTYSTIAKLIGSQYLSRIPINKSACAYVKGKSYLDFLEPHRHNYFFLRLDLKSFFYSIDPKIVQATVLEYFSNHPISDNCNQTHASAVLNLISYKLPKNSENFVFKGRNVIPIGFPLSPAISNIVFRKTDILIERFCDKHNISYTRYADDMLFSVRGELVNAFERLVDRSKSKFVANYLHSDDFVKQIAILLSVDGFKLNPSKTLKAIDTFSINGYTISGVNFSDLRGHIRISNKKTKIIEKLVHEIKQKQDDRVVFKKCFSAEVPKAKSAGLSGNFEKKFCTDQINNKLIGYRSYLISLILFDDKFSCITPSAKHKYSKIIDLINITLNRRIQ
jgi:hypothetical protein